MVSPDSTVTPSLRSQFPEYWSPAPAPPPRQHPHQLLYKSIHFSPAHCLVYSLVYGPLTCLLTTCDYLQRSPCLQCPLLCVYSSKFSSLRIICTPANPHAKTVNLLILQYCIGPLLLTHCYSSIFSVNKITVSICPIRPPQPVVSFIHTPNSHASPLTTEVTLTAGDISISVLTLLDSGLAGSFISGELCHQLQLKRRSTEVK